MSKLRQISGLLLEQRREFLVAADLNGNATATVGKWVLEAATGSKKAAHAHPKGLETLTTPALLGKDRRDGETLSISVPQKPLFRCDNPLTFWQVASVVMKEGEESYMTNLCQQCNNKSLDAKPLTKWQWYEFVEKKAHRGRLWTLIGKEQYIREI